MNDSTVTVSGQVTDEATGAPIQGALVRGHITVGIYQGPDFFERCPYEESTANERGEYE